MRIDSRHVLVIWLLLPNLTLWTKQRHNAVIITRGRLVHYSLTETNGLTKIEYMEILHKTKRMLNAVKGGEKTFGKYMDLWRA